MNNATISAGFDPSITGPIICNIRFIYNEFDLFSQHLL